MAYSIKPTTDISAKDPVITLSDESFAITDAIKELAAAIARLAAKLK